MGKKKRRERLEKREDFAAKRTREKRKSNMIMLGVIGLVAVIVGISSYNFIMSDGTAPGSPPGAGILGGEHSHVSILVNVFGDKFNFASPAFQIKSSWMHFEGQEGKTIHKHASGVTFGYFIGTLGLGLTDECFEFPDGRQFCTNEDYSLKFYINHEQVPSLLSFDATEGDRVLITYGSDSEEEIEKQLLELDNLTVTQ